MKFAYQHEMLAGFRAAMKELGLEEDQRLISAFDWGEPANLGAIADWLKQTDRATTAFFACGPG